MFLMSAADCNACGAKLGTYFCSICRLWDNAPGRQIYHCPYCNLCRRGAGELFCAVNSTL